jgi:uncharacterized Rossmann fold enzyme
MADELIFKFKDGKIWSGVPLSVFRGLRTLGAWVELDNHECVAELRDAETKEVKGYVCGAKGKWLKHYKAKGAVVISFAQASEEIAKANRALLDITLTDVAHKIESVFEGTVLESVREIAPEGA